MYLGEKLYIASYKETVLQDSCDCFEAAAFKSPERGEGGGGGKLKHFGIKGEVFLKRVKKKKTFGCELISNQKYFRPHM